jgi:beta-lactamase superfamily II metal-dependent hydrolase
MFFRVLIALTLVSTLSFGQARDTLDIYFIDVEGGQATLIVTPSGETVLVDAGYASDGRVTSKPGDPNQARDARRIVAAARDAGVERIDYLWITHYHPDHIGGVTELAQLIPIRTFVDRGDSPSANSADVREPFAMYGSARGKGTHLEAKPGAQLPLKGIQGVIVSSAGKVVSSPLPGSGQENSSCQPPTTALEGDSENAYSAGFRLELGKFRFLDLGDLTGKPLADLFCPIDMVGPTDLFLVPHHGGADVAARSLFGATPPTVAIINNGRTKGGAAATFTSLRALASTDVWQLHLSSNQGVRNFADERIANLDESTSFWIHVRAKSDGSFQVTNPRTQTTTKYPARN